MGERFRSQAIFYFLSFYMRAALFYAWRSQSCVFYSSDSGDAICVAFLICAITIEIFRFIQFFFITTNIAIICDKLCRAERVHAVVDTN